MTQAKQAGHTLFLTSPTPGAAIEAGAASLQNQQDEEGEIVVLTILGSLAETIVRSLMLVAGYVTNSSTFPQPLSEDEEAKYLAKLQTGDDTARSILIERNLRLVAHIVNAFVPKLQRNVRSPLGNGHLGGSFPV